MQRLKGVYAMRFHRRHHTSGHLFKRPYHSRPILTVEHLHRGCGYTLRNAVRHGLVSRSEEWEWSSFRTVAGLASPPRPHLECRPFLQLLGLDETTERLTVMRSYTRDAPPAPSAALDATGDDASSKPHPGRPAGHALALA